MNTEAEAEGATSVPTYEPGGPEAQLCYRILFDWRIGGDALEECLSTVRSHILQWAFMESNSVCRSSAMRRESYRLSFGDAKSPAPSNTSSVRHTEPASFHPTTVEYISPFPSLPSKGKICKFANLYYHDRIWYFVTPDESSVSQNISNCNLNSQPYPDDAPFTPTVISAKDFAAHVHYSSAEFKELSETLILINRYQALSHGHVIQDSVIPLFHLLRAAGIDTKDNFTIIHNDKDVTDASLTDNMASG